MVEIKESTQFEKALAQLEAATLKLHQIFRKEQALNGLREAVYHGYQQTKNRCDSRLAPAKRRKYFSDLLKAVRAVRSKYEDILIKGELIDPLVWASGEPDLPAAEKYINKVVAWLEVQEVVLEKAGNEAAKAVGGNKGTTYLELDIFINQLANVWEKQTQKAVTRKRLWRRPEQRSTADLSPYGPFIDFVKCVVQEQNLNVKSNNLAEYIDKVLDRRDRDRARDFRMPSLIDLYDKQMYHQSSQMK